jgi:hypothetical protein
VTRRLLSALVLVGCALAGPSASAADGDAPSVDSPLVTPDTAASVDVSISLDTHNSETVVKVEYAPTGVYRAARNPGPATTVTVATVPASAGGPATVLGKVTGLEPGTTYQMRIRATNAGGETLSDSLDVTTPAANKIAFSAKVGADTTRITKLTVAGIRGAESVTLRCTKAADGCPFSTKTVGGAPPGTLKLSRLVKRAALDPGAKLAVRVEAYGTRVSSLTLVIRDDQQPKVKRG